MISESVTRAWNGLDVDDQYHLRKNRDRLMKLNNMGETGALELLAVLSDYIEVE